MKFATIVVNTTLAGELNPYNSPFQHKWPITIQVNIQLQLQKEKKKKTNAIGV